MGFQFKRAHTTFHKWWALRTLSVKRLRTGRPQVAAGETEVRISQLRPAVCHAPVHVRHTSYSMRRQRVERRRRTCESVHLEEGRNHNGVHGKFDAPLSVSLPLCPYGPCTKTALRFFFSFFLCVYQSHAMHEWQLLHCQCRDRQDLKVQPVVYCTMINVKENKPPYRSPTPLSTALSP